MAFDIDIRNPGSTFNINMAETIAFIIGAFWGIKVSVA